MSIRTEAPEGARIETVLNAAGPFTKDVLELAEIDPVELERRMIAVDNGRKGTGGGILDILNSRAKQVIWERRVLPIAIAAVSASVGFYVGSEYTSHYRDALDLKEVQAFSAAAWGPVCDNKVPGTWYKTEDGKRIAANVDNGSIVDLTVKGSDGSAKATADNLPADCLKDGAPRFIAALHPSANDVVRVCGYDDPLNCDIYNFEPSTRSSNALQENSDDMFPTVEFNGPAYLSCDTTRGCEEDIKALGRKL